MLVCPFQYSPSSSLLLEAFLPTHHLQLHCKLLLLKEFWSKRCNCFLMEMADALLAVWLPMANPNLDIFLCRLCWEVCSFVFSWSLFSAATGTFPSITGRNSLSFHRFFCFFFRSWWSRNNLPRWAIFTEQIDGSSNLTKHLYKEDTSAAVTYWPNSLFTAC